MQDTFKRYEKKFILSNFQYQEIISSINGILVSDAYSNNGEYPIYNIYLDSKNDTSIRKSINKPYFKEKIRIRTYDINSKEVFLEAKYKIGNIVYKRRVKLTLAEILDMIYQNIFPSNLTQRENQITKEILCAIRQDELYPKLFLSYSREAYYSNNNDNFRLTFDKNIKYRYNQILFPFGSFGKDILPNDSVIMEVKFVNAIPKWFTDILSKSKIYEHSYSKYGNAYKDYISSKRRI